MQTFEQQIDQANIPYPQREHLKQEIAEDLIHSGSQESPVMLLDQDLDELRDLHTNILYKGLHALGPLKRPTEFVSAFGPLLISILFFFKEEKMFEFVQEGGVGMFAVLAVGLFLLGSEILHTLRLVVIKDHSRHNIDLDSASLILPCFGLLFLGAGLTLHNLYVTANHVAAHVGNSQMLILGIKESITPLILSFIILSLVVFARSGTRAIVKKWQIPVPA